MRGEQRLRAYLQGTLPGGGSVTHDATLGAYTSSGNGAIEKASGDWADAMTYLSAVISAIELSTPAPDALGDTATGRDAHHAFVNAAKKLRERQDDFQKVQDALTIAGGGISYGHQKLNELPVAVDPGPKPPNPVNTNDWDPVMNMALARWYGNKATFDNNPEVRDRQADAAADQMDTQFQAAIDKINGITAAKAPGSPSGTGGGGSTTTTPSYDGGSGGPSGSMPHTTYTTTYAPHTTHTGSTSLPHLPHDTNPNDGSGHHTGGTSSGNTGTGSSNTGTGSSTVPGYDPDGTLAGGSRYAAPTSVPTDLPAAGAGTGLPGGGGLGRAGGSVAAGGLGAAGLAAGLRMGGLGGLGGLGGMEPSLSSGAVSRGINGITGANALGASSRAGGSAVTGRTTAVGSGGTGAGGARGSKDKKKGRAFSSYDDGSDWIEDDDVAPGVLR